LRAHTIGIVFALACLTRYEAWPAYGAAVILVVMVLWRCERPIRHAVHAVLPIALWPASAIFGFMAFSRLVVGEWFVSSGFFVPDNPVQGRPLAVVADIVRGLRELSGDGLVALGLFGLAALAVMALWSKGRESALVTLSLVTTAALPFAAFFNGHPFRIRYMVPLIAAQAVGVGLLVGFWRVLLVPALVAAALAVAVELRPLEATAPMVLEAQWDRPSSLERKAVTACLRDRWDGKVILVSMGSLGHYMQELSHEGFDIRDFIHEGNVALWNQGMQKAGSVADWILVSERPDGRDALVTPVRDNPGIVEGFVRVCEGGQVALYQKLAD
jgi:hypothetical protein